MASKGETHRATHIYQIILKGVLRIGKPVKAVEKRIRKRNSGTNLIFR
jgi:hypothetical protein